MLTEKLADNGYLPHPPNGLYVCRYLIYYGNKAFGI